MPRQSCTAQDVCRKRKTQKKACNDKHRQVMDQYKGSRAAWNACFELGQTFACTKHRTDNVAMAHNAGKGALTTQNVYYLNKSYNIEQHLHHQTHKRNKFNAMVFFERVQLHFL